MLMGVTSPVGCIVIDRVYTLVAIELALSLRTGSQMLAQSKASSFVFS
jgi:hypothetical protein